MTILIAIFFTGVPFDWMSKLVLVKKFTLVKYVSKKNHMFFMPQACGQNNQ
jgi:hypothetical protein